MKDYLMKRWVLVDAIEFEVWEIWRTKMFKTMDGIMEKGIYREI